MKTLAAVLTVMGALAFDSGCAVDATGNEEESAQEQADTASAAEALICRRECRPICVYSLEGRSCRTLCTRLCR